MTKVTSKRETATENIADSQQLGTGIVTFDMYNFEPNLNFL